MFKKTFATIALVAVSAQVSTAAYADPIASLRACEVAVINYCAVNHPGQTGECEAAINLRDACDSIFGGENAAVAILDQEPGAPYPFISVRAVFQQDDPDEQPATEEPAAPNGGGDDTGPNDDSPAVQID